MRKMRRRRSKVEIPRASPSGRAIPFQSELSPPWPDPAQIRGGGGVGDRDEEEEEGCG